MFQDKVNLYDEYKLSIRSEIPKNSIITSEKLTCDGENLYEEDKGSKIEEIVI